MSSLSPTAALGAASLTSPATTPAAHSDCPCSATVAATATTPVADTTAWDSLLADLDAPLPVTSAEAQFVKYISVSRPGELQNLIFHLRNELGALYIFRQHNIQITKLVSDKGTIVNRPLTATEISRLYIETYLNACYLTRFHATGFGGTLLDMQDTIDKIIDLPDVKACIRKETTRDWKD